MKEQFDEVVVDRAIALMQHPIKSKLAMLRSIPLNFFTGIQVVELSRERAVTTVRYGWLTSNPFRSIFWAVLGMASELASGAIAMTHVYGQPWSVSMILVGQRGVFKKKAVGRVRCVCKCGEEIRAAVLKAANGEAGTVDAHTEIFDEDGQLLAEFVFTWSFKRRVRD